MKTIRIALADDHKILLKSLSYLLDGEDDFDVVITAFNGKNLLSEMKQKEVDVVLLDIEMPVMDARSVLPVLNKYYRDTKVIVLSFYDSISHIRKFLREGADAFLSKSVDINILTSAIRGVYEFGYYLYGQVTKEFLAELYFGNQSSPQVLKGDSLTEREKQIVRLICQGKTNCQIADSLCLSQRTIESHRMRISKKIGTNTSSRIVVYAVKMGIYDMEKEF